ncbi:M81 family metallopeptidase [Consotaella aegiceratis]|uniref:M81 family metallopeptidase n=1 Tax=Consotaella aegiceratis TaxID=3097961 RepID=UPI002F3F8FC5
MRIAVGGLHIECSSYNPSLTTAADFRILRGEELLHADAFRFLGDFDAEFLPTFHARAVPGAPLAADTYEAFKDEILRRMAEFGEVDGVYLALHGAAFVDGMEDVEGDLVGAVRALVGPDCPISASYDLHGNLSQTVIDGLDLFTAYRTAPHIDAEETMRRAVGLLVRHIESGRQAGLCWCPIPVCLPGERTSTEDEPARSLYARLPSIAAANPGIWDASLMVGYVWADEPRVTAAAVLTGTDRAAMEAQARDLALAYWQARADFVFGTETGSIDDCVQQALTATTKPVVLADSGDNPTAGGAGDRTDVLAALIAAKADDVILAGIADRPATEAAYEAGVGAEIAVSVGATIAAQDSEPLAVTATVVTLAETDEPTERQAVLKVGGIRFVVTARRRPFHAIADFTRLGLDPRAARIVVVKSGYLSPELAPIANPSLMALSPGIVDQDVERLPRERTSRPTYPFDRDFDFTPQVFWSERANSGQR